MNLRDYQQQAHDAVLAQWKNHQATLLVLPTGTGKTVVFTHVIEAMVRNGGRAMVLAHREELLHQAAEKIRHCTDLDVEIEQGLQRASNDWLKKAKVVVASTQTMLRRGTRFDPAEFSVVVIDEAHHYVSPSWQGVVRHFLQNVKCKVLGVTATPDRGDQKALGRLFTSVAYKMEIQDAIDGGWLVPIHQKIVRVGAIDLSGVKTVAGDLRARDLADVMGAEKVLHPIVCATINEAAGRKTIVFAPPGFRREGTAAFRVCDRLTEMFNRYEPGSTALVTGRTPDDERRDILGRFSSGNIRRVVNVGVLTEGFDDPSIGVVAVARPTKSRALYAQMVGRGTRPLGGLVDGHGLAGARCEAIAGSAKPHITVLDFEGNSGRHKLVNALDILGGKHDADVIELARKRMIQSGATADARAELEAAARAKREMQLLEADRKAKARETLLAKVTYKVTDVDPFDILSLVPPRPSDAQYVKSEPPTEKQLNLLVKFGVPITPDLTVKTASRLIGTLIERSRKKLCNYWWCEQVRRHGGDPTRMTADQAREYVKNNRRLYV